MNPQQTPCVRELPIERCEAPARHAARDLVAVEEPLAIWLEYSYKRARRVENLTVTMRTPGHDEELALGFLYAESILQKKEDVIGIRNIGAEQANELVVELAPEVDVDTSQMMRSTMVNASCGVCGKRSLEALGAISGIAADEGFYVPASLLRNLPERLRNHQSGFVQTGGLHAAALVSAKGEIAAVYEDVGRHNALDKLIGSLILTANALPLYRQIVFLSSRSSFELVQKAAKSGAPVLATVGSPSTLAIDAAERAGITLAGFVRDGRFNLYTHPWRVHS